MKSIMRLAAIATLMFAGTASADLILVGENVADGGNSNPDTEVGIVNSTLGSTVVFDWRCEADLLEGCLEGVGDVSGGLYKVFPFVDTSPATSEVEWDLTGTGYMLLAIVAKTAGSLNIYEVSGDMGLTGTGTVMSPDGIDSISHISFFVGKGEITVPEPGTLALLGLGLIGMGVARRRKVA